MSKAETIIKRVPRKRKYIYRIHSTCHGLGRNDYIYNYFFPALMRYLILALADPLRHDYIELVREHRCADAGYSPEDTAHLLKQPIALVKAVTETANDKGPGF